MREADVLIDPIAAGQALIIELARREGDLAVDAVDPVAIIVDAGEVVVGPDFLKLREGGTQGLVVP